MHQTDPPACTPASNMATNDNELIDVTNDANQLAPDELLSWLETYVEDAETSRLARGITLSRREWETIAEAWDAAQKSKKKGFPRKNEVPDIDVPKPLEDLGNR